MQNKMVGQMASDTSFHAGFAVLVGWTNSGKSTLINRLVGMPIAITAPSSQTTRHRIMGIVQGDNYQLAVMDTPGLHHPKKELSKRMMRTTWDVVSKADIVVWLVAPDKTPDAQFRSVKLEFQRLSKPLIIAINKIDTVRKHELLPLIEKYRTWTPTGDVIPISALHGDNVDVLLKIIIGYLPENPPMFDENEITDQPERLLAAEVIREQVIKHTYQEIPHAVAVDVDLFKEIPEKKLIRIMAVIYVERKSQKGIVIGKEGRMLKKIGTDARLKLETLFETAVVLNLWVKVSENWRNDPRKIKQLGLVK